MAVPGIPLRVFVGRDDEWREASGSCHQQTRHPGEGRDLTLPEKRTGKIPAFAGMTDKGTAAHHPKADLQTRTKKGGAGPPFWIPTFAGMTHFQPTRFQRMGKCVT